MLDNAKDLACELLARPSVSPVDGGCQQVLMAELESAGFVIEDMSSADVTNLWARYGDQSPVLAFAGHTDVVPPGPEESWRFPPFTPTVSEGFLYGRGAADMKTAVAAMVVAAKEFVAAHGEFAGSIAFLITSCEEESTDHGTKHVMKALYDRGEHIDYCIIGEASSDQNIGDQIKVGRRGSLSGTLTITGKQGHIAYPQLASNPIHNALPALCELTQTMWGEASSHFPPTSLQFSNVHAGEGANNVIPESVELLFNFRYASNVSASALRQKFEAILEKHQQNYHIDWYHSGEPFLTEGGELIAATEESLKEIAGNPPILSTTGGTSDGRFIAPYGVQTIELGFCNATIHQVNERIAVEHIDILKNMYKRILEKVFIA